MVLVVGGGTGSGGVARGVLITAVVWRFCCRRRFAGLTVLSAYVVVVERVCGVGATPVSGWGVGAVDCVATLGYGWVFGASGINGGKPGGTEVLDGVERVRKISASCCSA